jgi:hypothetical protein
MALNDANRSGFAVETCRFRKSIFRSHIHL